MAISLPILLIVIYVIQNVYLRTSRQLRYLNLEAKSPIYSHFLETFEGLPVIRAFGWQRNFVDTSILHLENLQKPYYLLFCVQRWLSLVLDLVVAGMAVVVVALAIQIRSSTSAGLLGMALTNVLTFNKTLTSMITAWTNLETSLGATALVKTFAENTASGQLDGERQVPPDDWPGYGAVEFKDLSASYNSTGTPVLEQITMNVSPGERIGIYGRTGSGKSSLLLSVLRLVEIQSGTITVDGLTDRVMQKVIREEFKEHTIITVAHRVSGNRVSALESNADVSKARNHCRLGQDSGP